MTIVKSTYIRGKSRIKAHLRYITHRKGLDIGRITRPLFGPDGALSKLQIYEMIDAVRWGARHARSLGARLHLVHATALPQTPSAALAAPGVGRRPSRSRNRVLARATAEACRYAGDIDVSAQALSGAADRVLVEASANAGLLVVGSRGPGPAAADGPRAGNGHHGSRRGPSQSRRAAPLLCRRSVLCAHVRRRGLPEALARAGRGPG